jgi:AcrR family transcriptional regulator
MESSVTRARIVDAAQTLFASRGFANVSVDEIAAAAGVTKGAVYYSFKDKKDVFRAACARILDTIRHAVEAATMGDVEHSIDEIVTGGARLFDAYEHPAARQLLLIDGPAVLGLAEWTKMQEVLRVELGEHALGHIADAGLIDRAVVPMLSHLLFGAFTQGVLQIATADPETAGAAAREAYRRLANGLLTPPLRRDGVGRG